MGAGIQGPSSSQTPYLKPLDSSVTFESIITTGDTVTGSFLSDGTTPWRFVGIPDGIGAFDNGDGTFTVLVNHELGATVGIARAHGSIGAFVDRLVIDKDTLAVVSASDLDTKVFLYDAATGTYTLGTTAFGRFCSADLAAPSAFYDAATGLGTQERIYLNGEEVGNEGRSFAHIVTGANAGSAYELAHLGNLSFENAVASPTAGAKTIVVSLDDSTPGQVYVYVGDKKATGTEIEKAGLVGGKTYGIKVGDIGANETDGTTLPDAGSTFELVALGTAGDVSALTGAELQTQSVAGGVTEFLRPEDGAWDPTNANRFYFVTTNGIDHPSRLWALDFTDIANPEAGGKIELLLDGTEGQVMFDNLTVAADGKVYIQEDPGNNVRLSKVWVYDPATDTASVLAEHDAARFSAQPTAAASFLTQDEESSGIVDVTHILGSPGKQAFLLDTQNHLSSADPALVEGGQLQVMFVDTPIEGPPGDKADFNGDGTSDIAFQNLDGSVLIWEVDGTSVIGGQGAPVGNPGPDAFAIGTGDFFGDGTSNILFQNIDGDLEIWELDGTTLVGGAGFPVAGHPGADKFAIGTGDFNGDGKSDVAFQALNGDVSIWEIVGTNVIGGEGVTVGSPGPDWLALGTGDFNGDGLSDILFQHTSGAVSIWELDGTDVIGGQGTLVGSNPGPDWLALGTGDFDGNGKSDILFQHTDGAVSIWELNGTEVVGGVGTLVGPNPGPEWHAAATGDYNGDGRSDILFQHDSGAVSIWELNGTEVIGGIGTLVGTTDPSWLVV